MYVWAVCIRYLCTMPVCMHNYCLCLDMSVCFHSYLCMCARVRWSLQAWLCVSVSLNERHECLCLHICLCSFISVPVSLCVCARVCVCLRKCLERSSLPRHNYSFQASDRHGVAWMSGLARPSAFPPGWVWGLPSSQNSAKPPSGLMCSKLDSLQPKHHQDLSLTSHSSHGRQ